MDLSTLRVGDTVIVTLDGRDITLTVWAVTTDPSIGAWDALTVHARIRPGGYGMTLRRSNLARYHARKG